MQNLAPVDLTTLQERVYQRLGEAISRGEFAPGEVLTIRKLAASLGTSAMPVREALQRLVAEKALIQRANRSVIVAPLYLDGFKELIRIRTNVEAFATRSAVMKCDEKLISNLVVLNQKMKRAVISSAIEHVLECNKKFHFKIYDRAEMPQLQEIIKSLWLRTGPYLGAAYRSVPGAAEQFMTATRTHDRIISAFHERDANRAGRAMALDIWLTAKKFTPAIKQISGNPSKRR